MSFPILSPRKYLAMVTLFTFLIQLTPIGLIPAYAAIPTVTSAFAGDANSDDTMDRIVLTFSEDIYGTTDGSNFTISGWSCNIASASEPTPGVITLILSNCQSGTDKTVTVVYTPGDLKSVSTDQLVAGFSAGGFSIDAAAAALATARASELAALGLAFTMALA